MKAFLRVALTLALLLGCSALAVELLDDRALFVPPPDAVAEGFTREVMTKRWSRAREYLADRDSLSDAQLEALQSRLGSGGNPDAQIMTRDDSHAIVTVTLEEQTMRVGLVWEEEWRVNALGREK
jgi:hypothetical protein